MKIINTVPSSGGSYRIQDDPSRTSPPGGYARVPEELDLAEFYAAKGFVSPSFEDKFSFSGLQVALWGTINIHQKCSNVNVKQRGSQTVAPLLTLTHKIR